MIFTNNVYEIQTRKFANVRLSTECHVYVTGQI